MIFFVLFLTVVTQKYLLVKTNMSDLIMYYTFYVFIHFILRVLSAFIIDVDFSPFLQPFFALILCCCFYFCTLDSAYLKY